MFDYGCMDYLVHCQVVLATITPSFTHLFHRLWWDCVGEMVVGAVLKWPGVSMSQ